MNPTTNEIMERGIRCLMDNLGTIGAERFISAILRERFDYTKWQREYFDRMSAEELHEAAVNYAKEHPFQGKSVPLEENK